MKTLIKLFSLNFFVFILSAGCGENFNFALQEECEKVNGECGFTNQQKEKGLNQEDGAEIYTCKCGHEWDDHKEKGNGEKGECRYCGCNNYRLDESKLPDCKTCDHKYKDHNINGGSCKRCSCKEYDDGEDFEKY